MRPLSGSLSSSSISQSHRLIHSLDTCRPSYTFRGHNIARAVNRAKLPGKVLFYIYFICMIEFIRDVQGDFACTDLSRGFLAGVFYGMEEIYNSCKG